MAQAEDQMKILEIAFTVDLKIKVDPSQLEAFEARLDDNPQRDSAATCLIHEVVGKNWLDSVPNRKMLTADPTLLKAVKDAAGFLTTAERETALKEAAEARRLARAKTATSPAKGAEDKAAGGK